MKFSAVKAAVVSVFAVSAAFVGAALFSSGAQPSDERNVENARRQAGLAPLPPSVSGLRTLRHSTLMWTAYYIKFQARPEEINVFLKASPGLRPQKLERFSGKHPYLTLPAGGGDYSSASPPAYFHDEIFVRRDAPWFDRTITQAGRRYKIERGAVYGEVVVNDATHTVLIYMADS